MAAQRSRHDRLAMTASLGLVGSVLLTACGGGSDEDPPNTSPPAQVAPTVQSLVPANGSTGVALDTSPVVTFDRDLDPSTVNGSTVALTGPAGTVAGVVSLDLRTVRFDPSVDLTQGTTYTLSLSSDILGLNGLEIDPVSVSFETVHLPAPAVVSTIPDQDAVDVALDVRPSVTFDSDLDELTVGAATVSLRTASGPVVGQVDHDPTTRTVTFTPDEDLVAGTEHFLELSSGIQGINGTAIADFTLHFTTAVALPPLVVETMPANGATGVTYTIRPTVTFDADLDPATVHGQSVTLSGPNGLEAGDATLDSTARTIRFIPAAAGLDLGAAYSLFLTSEILGANGAAIAPFELSFVIEVAATPQVVSTVPMNNATDVALSIEPRVNFDSDLDLATVTNQSVTLSGPSGPVPGDAILESNARTVRFDPNVAELASGTVYTLHLTSDILGTNGAAIDPFMLSFRTFAPAPQVVSTTPAQDANEQSLDISPTVTFDSDLDGATVNSANVTLQGPNGPVGGSVLNPTPRVVTFDPSSDLEPDTPYTLQLRSQILGANGTAIAPFELRFRTKTRPSITRWFPVDGATGVVRQGLVIEVEFDRPMDAASVEAQGTIRLRRAGVNVPSDVQLQPNGTVVTVEPQDTLDMLATYVVRVDGSARSLEGITLGSTQTVSFTTADGAFDSSSQTVAPGVAGSDAQPDIALSSNGEATAVFQDFNLNGFATGARFDPNSAMPWQTPEAIDDHSQISGLTVVTDDLSRAAATWRFQDEIRFNLFNNGWLSNAQVLSAANGAPGDAVLSMAPDGRGIVAWPREDLSAGGAGPRFNIAYRFFDSTGNLGALLQVISADQDEPIQDLSIGIDAASRAVIAFTMRTVTPGQGNPYRVHAAHVLNFNGSFTAPFTIDDGNLSRDDAIDVSLAVAGGRALVAWVQDSQTCSNCNDWRNRLWANRLDLSMGAWDSPALIDDPNQGNSQKPVAALGADGSIGMVAWRQNAGVNLFETLGVHRIDMDMMLPGALGTAVLLNTVRPPLDLELALDRDGNGLVVFRAENSPGRYDVMARRYVASQDAFSPEFEIENITASAFRPRLSMTPDGRAMVIWFAYSPGGPARIDAIRFE